MNKTEQWQKLIRDYETSDLTQKEFCQSHAIKIHTLHYWIKKLSSGSDRKEHFVPFSPVQSVHEISIKIGHAQITLNMTEVARLLVELDQAGLLYDPA